MGDCIRTKTADNRGRRRVGKGTFNLGGNPYTTGAAQAGLLQILGQTNHPGSGNYADSCTAAANVLRVLPLFCIKHSLLNL